MHTDNQKEEKWKTGAKEESGKQNRHTKNKTQQKCAVGTGILQHLLIIAVRVKRMQRAQRTLCYDSEWGNIRKIN